MAGGRIPGENPEIVKTPEQIAQEKIAKDAKNAEVEAEQRAWNQWYYNDFLIRSGAYKPVAAKDMWEETAAPIKSTLSDEDGVIQSNGIPRSLKVDTYYRLSGDYDIEMYVSREKDQYGKLSDLMTLRATSNLSGIMPGAIAKREDFYRKAYMQLAMQGDLRVVINFPKEAKPEFIKIDEIHRMMRIAKECKLEIDFGDKIQEFIQRDVSERSVLDTDRMKQNQLVSEDRDATLNSSQYYQNRKHQEIKIKVNSELGSIKQNFSDAKNNIEISLNDTSPDANPAAAIKNAETTFKTVETRMKNALAEAEIFVKNATSTGRAEDFKNLSDTAFAQIKADYDALKALLDGKIRELSRQIDEKATEINRLGSPAEGTPDHTRKKELEAQKAKLVNVKEAIKNGDSGFLPKFESIFKEIEKAKITFDQTHKAKVAPAPAAPAPGVP